MPPAGGPGPARLTEALDGLIGEAQRIAVRHGVTFLPSDIDRDGLKLMLVAAAPRRLGLDVDRMIATLRGILDLPKVMLVRRAGMSVGRVFAGDYGPPYRRTYSLLGDSVNLAARLMSQAEPGELLGPAAVLKEARGSFSATARPPLRLKGKREPQLAVSLGSPTDTRGGDTAEGRLFGRDRELGMLLAAVPTAETRTGQVIELVGAPGIGKSRLLEELRARAPARVLWTDGDVYRSATPYAPFARLLRSRRELSTQLPDSLLLERLGQIVDSRAPHLAPWLPLIAAVGGLDVEPTPEVDALDPGARQATLQAVTSELLGAALDRPTVLVFNDTHLMDPSSLDLLDRLCADAVDRPWLIVTARRPDGRPLDPGPAPHSMVTLEPLPPDVARELIRGVARGAAPPALIDEIVDRGEGNALFVRELAAQVGSISAEPNGLPGSVEEAIAARIDRLPAGARRVLRTAAVLGERVELPLLTELLEDSGPPEPQVLTDFLQDSGDGIAWRFSHQLIREVAYAGLPRRRRRELHDRIAGALVTREGDASDVDLLAVHLHGAGRYQAAFDASLQAADRAERRYASAEAAVHYRRALEVAPKIDGLAPAARAAVALRLGDCLGPLGEWTAAGAVMRQAHRIPGIDPHLRARLSTAIALTCLQALGRPLLALRWLERGFAAVEALDDPESALIKATVARRQAGVLSYLDRRREADRAAARAVALLRVHGDAGDLARALRVRADIHCADLARAEVDAWLAEALKLTEDGAGPVPRLEVFAALGERAYFRGDWKTALAHYRASATLATAMRLPAYVAVVRTNIAEILIKQARYEEARHELASEEVSYSRATTGGSQLFSRFLLAQIAAGCGDRAGAADLYARLRSDAGEAPLVRRQVDAFASENLLCSGRADLALAAIDSLTEELSETASPELNPMAHRVRGESLIAVGDLAAGAAALARSLETARASQLPLEIARTADALLRHGLAGTDPDSLTQELEAISARLELQRRPPGR